MIVRCDDAERGYAYDWMSHVDRLGRALGEAVQSGRQVIFMHDDWSRVIP